MSSATIDAPVRSSEGGSVVGEKMPSATAVEPYTPPSLSDRDTPPVFLLRAGTRQDRDLYQRLIIVTGLRYHPAQRLRDETMNGLRALWDEASFQQNAGRVRAYWAAVDALGRSGEGGGNVDLDFPVDEARAIEALLSRVSDAWEPVRRLGADNALFLLRSPAVMLSIVLMGWEGVDASYVREWGVVPLDALEKVEAQLDAMEREQSGGDVAHGGRAYADLCAAAGQRLFDVTESAR